VSVARGIVSPSFELADFHASTLLTAVLAIDVLRAVRVFFDNDDWHRDTRDQLSRGYSGSTGLSSGRLLSGWRRGQATRRHGSSPSFGRQIAPTRALCLSSAPGTRARDSLVTTAVTRRPQLCGPRACRLVSRFSMPTPLYADSASDIPLVHPSASTILVGPTCRSLRTIERSGATLILERWVTRDTVTCACCGRLAHFECSRRPPDRRNAYQSVATAQASPDRVVRENKRTRSAPRTSEPST